MHVSCNPTNHMSTITKRKHTPLFKLKLVLEAIKSGDVSQTGRKYGINATLLAKWKKRLEEEGQHIFEKTPDQEKEQLKKQIGKLEQMIGKKEVELNLLKNFSDFYASQNSP